MKSHVFVLLTVMLALSPMALGQSLADYQFSTGHDSSKWYTIDSTYELLSQGNSNLLRWSTVQNIGFTFPFASSQYTQFSVTHDGTLRLGSVVATSNTSNYSQFFHPSRCNTNNPKLNFFGCRGYSSDSVHIYKQVFGTAPDRILVVDFALSTYNSSSRRSIERYQVHLHENGDIEVIYNSVPPTILPAASRQIGMCVDVSDVLVVDSSHNCAHYTAGCTSLIPAPSWPDTNRYYRFAFPQNVCLAPNNLMAAAIEDTAITIQWDGVDFTSTYLVEYSSTPITPGQGAVTPITVYDTTIRIGGLQTNTQYYFYVRTVCSDTSNAAQVVARTLQASPVSDFPYYCTFESDSLRTGWIVPGSLSTRWCMGTAVNNTPNGQYALYVSQDNGATNTGGDDWIGTYVYRDLNLVPGDWLISFDWRAYGDFLTNSAGVTNYYHFMRAFLVPAMTTFTVGSVSPSFPASPHSTAVPSGWIELNPDGHAFAMQNTWTNCQKVITLTTSGCYHLVFYWETDGYEPSTDMPAALDNILVEWQSCPQPHNVAATPSDTDIFITWDPNSNASNWMITYGTFVDFTQDTSYLATGLTRNTPYEISVYAICGAGDTSLPTTISTRTTDGGPVTQYPYVCNFEDSLIASQWVTLNNGQVNQWHVGTAANNTPQGQKSLYVSQDNGISNTYSGTVRSRSYAYRRLLLDTSEYVCTFDWRCLGDTDFHFMRAFIVPEASIPAAGTFPANDNLHIAVPNHWIDLYPNTHFMSGRSSWVTNSQTFTVPDSGIYALLFMWENDDYTANNPPAAVDNIRIVQYDCPMPSGFVTSATQTSIDLAWDTCSDASIWMISYDTIADVVNTPAYTATGLTPNTPYTFRIKTLCHNADTSIEVLVTVRTACNPVSSLPYTEDFESYSVNLGNSEAFIPCWNRVRNYSTYGPYVNASSDTANQYLYWNLTSGLLDDVYVSLPELIDTIDVAHTELRFQALKIDILGLFADPIFVVGVMTDPDSVATFTPIDTITVTSTTYTTYSVPLTSYTGTGHYVTIRGTLNATANTSAMCRMDNVELRDVPYCRTPQFLNGDPGIDTIALSWTPGGNESSWIVAYGNVRVNTSTPNYVVRGLLPDSLYTFTIYSVCSFGDTSLALTGSFRTEEPSPCYAPQLFTAIPDTTSISLSWTPGGEEEAWVLSYNDVTDTVTTPQYVAAGLQPDREYLFAVIALCHYGYVSDTVYEYFSTLPLPAVCPPVTDLSVHQDPDNENLVTVTWSGLANTYAVAIKFYPEGTLFQIDTVNNVVYTLDFGSNASYWTAEVQSLCNDTLASEWASSSMFYTPGCTGIQDAEGTVSVALYPNPTDGYATLFISGIEGMATVSIIDLLGGFVATHSIDCGTGEASTLTLGTLPSGTYFVRINARGFSAVRKLVVR